MNALIPYKSALYHSLPLLPPGPRSWWLLLKLLGRRYPLVVYLRGSFLFLPLGLTSRLAASRYIEGEHVVNRYLKPIEELTGPVAERGLRLRIQREAARAARDILSRDATGAGPKVAIHAAASVASKSWPSERYSELADRLDAELGAGVHFLGSPADRALLESIAGGARRPHACHWSLGLPEVVALIAQCDLFIGNDSGLSHIAAAVGTRQVVIWGPAPLGITYPKALPGRSVIFWHDLPCRATCPEFQCNNPVRVECLKRTGVEDVVRAAHRLLEPGSEDRGEGLPASTAGLPSAPGELLAEGPRR